MKIIKPIETAYNGYRFRSRLEARYAVFFDRLRISYRYEEEGFVVDGRPYLPDFYLPDLGCWVEIKPEDFNLQEYKNYALLSGFASQVGPIICLRGLPSAGWNGTVYCNDISDNGSGGAYEEQAGFSYCEICEITSVSFSDSDTRLLSGNRHLCKADWSSWAELCDPLHRASHTIHPVYEAAQYAKQARFEHGETPCSTYL